MHELHLDSACKKMPKATPQQVSTAWPCGVRQDRVDGKQVSAPESFTKSTERIVSACLVMNFLAWHLLR